MRPAQPAPFLAVARASIWRRPPGRRDLDARKHTNYTARASIWRRPPGRRDIRALGRAAAGQVASIWRRPPGRRDVPSGGRSTSHGELQSGGGLLAAGTRNPPGSVPRRWRFNLAAASWPPGRWMREQTQPRAPGFNLAAASWPPGHAGDPGLADGHEASIWRRPPGRRDSPREPSIPVLELASIWRRPPGRRDRLDLRIQRLMAVLQSGGGLLAAGTCSTPPLKRACPTCFNLAAASWPPGPRLLNRWSTRSMRFNLAAASWPPGRTQTSPRRPMPLRRFNLAAASWPPGLEPPIEPPTRLEASIWRRPPGRRDTDDPDHVKSMNSTLQSGGGLLAAGTPFETEDR